MAVTLPDAFSFRRGVEQAVNYDLNLLLSGLREASSTAAASLFSNSNGVTFGTSGSVVTASVAPSGGGTNFLFSNANGVSFGTAGSTVTASVNTNYAPPGAYLTTAMASNRGTDFVQATANFFGTNASGTIASDAISVSVAPPGAGVVQFSAGTTSNTLSAITFADSNGVSFGLDAGGTMTATVKTDYQTSGAYLTTAQPVGNYAGTSTGMTGGSVTLDTDGIAISLPAYLTTAQPPGAYLTTAALSQDSSKYAGTNATMTGGSITVNTSGVSINLPAYLTTAQPPGAYLTTAMASDASTQFVQASATFFGTNASGTIASNAISVSVAAPGAGGSLNVSAGSTSNNLTAITFADSNGVSFGLSGSVVTATVQTNYLTTAMLSAASTQFVQANATVAGTNISGTIASNVISLSVASAAAAPTPASFWGLGTMQSGATTAGLFTSNSSYLQPIFLPYDISIGWMRLFVTNSVAANTTMATSNAATSVTNRYETGVFAVVYSYGGAGNLVYVTSGSGSIGMRLLASVSASNWTMSYEQSWYEDGAATQSSTVTSVSTSNLSVSSNFWANWTSVRFLDIPFALSLPAGAYWLAVGATTAMTTGYSTRFSSIGPRGTSVFMKNADFNAWAAGRATTSSALGPGYGGPGSISLVAQGTSSSLTLSNVSTSQFQPILLFGWNRTT